MIALVILPRISLDLYLPSLPALAHSLFAKDSQVQMTLIIFVIGYAFSMLIAGQLSDLIGRRRVLIYGLLLYIIATLVCATAHSIKVLIIARFFQALGGCCGTVVVRVMVKDGYQQEEQIKILSYLSATMAICPLFIPILGGTLQLYFGWRASFYLLAFFALLLQSIIIKQLNKPKINAVPVSISTLIQHYKMLFSHPLFMGYSLAVGFGWSCYFIFSFESPFILQSMLGFNAVMFGLLYSIPILGYLIGTQFTRQFANDIGWDKLIFIATLITLLGSILMTFLVLFFKLNWLIIIIPMLIIMTGLGIIFPCCQAAVMQPFPNIVGTASGLFFFIQMTIGGLIGFTLRYIHANIPLLMAITVLICAVVAVGVFYVLVVRRKVRIDD